MPEQKKVKAIFDTHVWISFLIGKRLQSVNELIASKEIQIVVAENIFEELKDVTSRPKIKKYFSKEKVEDLIELLRIVGLSYKIKPKHLFKLDPKDSYLLDLIDKSNANYLVTGDKELLALAKFKTAKIIRPNDFEKEITTLFK